MSKGKRSIASNCIIPATGFVTLGIFCICVLLAVGNKVNPFDFCQCLVRQGYKATICTEGQIVNNKVVWWMVPGVSRNQRADLVLKPENFLNLHITETTSHAM